MSFALTKKIKKSFVQVHNVWKWKDDTETNCVAVVAFQGETQQTFQIPP